MGVRPNLAARAAVPLLIAFRTASRDFGAAIGSAKMVEKIPIGRFTMSKKMTHKYAIDVQDHTATKTVAPEDIEMPIPN